VAASFVSFLAKAGCQHGGGKVFFFKKKFAKLKTTVGFLHMFSREVTA